jgi:peptidoglycan/xylan/chitin deacetylase (PgdA/CDA1 family)
MYYGKVHDQCWGFPKIMEICDRYKCRATFFVSVFQYKQYGENSLGEICQKIHENGHDVQLHTHPIWVYGRRYMHDFNLQEQIRIIGQGVELLQKWIGTRPIAHRAGGYGMNQDTLTALKANDIAVDSSMFYSEPQCKFVSTKNRVLEVNGIVELPVTICQVQFTISLGAFKYSRQFRYAKTDINAGDLTVLLQFVKEAKLNNLRVMNLFLHSYSFLNFTSSLKNPEPDYKDIDKFDNFLSAVINDPDIKIITVKEFYDLYCRNPKVFVEASDYVPQIRTKIGFTSAIRQASTQLNLPKIRMG